MATETTQQTETKTYDLVAVEMAYGHFTKGDPPKGGKFIPHRKDGPAVIGKDGSRTYFTHGVRRARRAGEA